ncbi:MAG: vWA domain-containing protein [Pseudomonadota bacterium]
MVARLRRMLASVVVAFCCAAAATAHAEEDVILVLDASGSMWGELDGAAKIVTARGVVGSLLNDLPSDRRLGLVAYGHNRKGDCSDIEEIAEVGAARDAIRNAVDALNPKGKTPLSASVKFAAEKLKYTENKATVILVSDGKETCDLDPCAVGAALEEAGIDFTAHVIGFDIAAEQDRAELQCLAEATGGQYFNAASAADLAGALQRTVAAPPEPEKESGFALRATELKGGPLVETDLAWTVRQAGGGDIVFEATAAGETPAAAPPGVYDISVERASDGLKGAVANVELRPGAQKTVTVALELAFDASVRVVPEDEAPVSSEVIVYWEGPARKGDYVTVVEKDARDNAYKDYEYIRNGNPLKLRMPTEAGEYEVRYVLSRPARVLARAAINATTVEARLDAPEAVAAGAKFDVDWTGPGYKDDWITIVKPAAGERAFTSYAYTREGASLSLTAPLEAGDYELRYVQAGKKVIARKAISVGAVEASVSGPETAMAGTRHQIAWTGPGGDRDWVTITAPDAAENRFTDYAYMRTGNPVTLLMPLEAGDYEIRYVQNGKKVIARKPVQITAAEASIDAPAAEEAGSRVTVRWTGPAEKNDWITLTKPDAAENRYTDYKYPKNGAELVLEMPVEPGAYEFRYALNGKKVVARKPVVIEDVSASLESPERVVAGAKLSVAWEGPGHYRDWVTITKPDAAENRYTSYKYARNGAPQALTAPKEPGVYEVRYVLGGKRVIARNPLTVVAKE